MWLYINRYYEGWLVILAVLTLVSCVEIFSPARDGRILLRDRLLNIGAGSLYLIVGGYAALLLVFNLARLGVFRPSNLDTFTYVALFLLLQDLVYYFYHRLQHNWSLLWGIHKLHHTDPDVNVTTSYRTHLLEQPVQSLLIAIPLLLAIGFHPTATRYCYYVGLFFLFLGHSRLDLSLGSLSGIFVGPRFHRLHHSANREHMNRNFAQVFSFLDRLFGSYERPRPLREIETGIPLCTSRRDQFAPIIWPASFILRPRGNADP